MRARSVRGIVEESGFALRAFGMRTESTGRIRGLSMAPTTPNHRADPIGGPLVARLVAISPLLLFVAVLLVSGSTRLFDRDETYYARAAVEMVESGDWLVPQFNGETFAHKPPLAYWLMAASMKAFGASDLSVRLPSAIALLATGLLTGLVARRLFDREVGRWATAIFMGAAMPLIVGSSSMLDMLLVFFITLGAWAFVEQVIRPAAWRWAWIPMTVSMGGSMLCKFPVGPAVLLPMFLVAVLIGRREIWAGWRPLAGTLLATALGLIAFLAWAIPANRATGGEMAQTGLMVHIVGRALEPMEGHGGSGPLGYLLTLPVYVPIVIAGMFPWIIHLPAGCSALVRRHLGTPRSRAVLWAWIVPPFVMFSLAATKLPHYLLPVFPPLAILAAAALAAYREGRLSEKDRDWLRGGAFFQGVVALLAATGLGLAGFAAAGVVESLPALAAALLMAGVGVLAAIWQLRERIAEVNALLLVSTPMLVVVAIVVGLGSIESLIKPGPEIAALVRARATPEMPVYAHGYREPGLLYYLGRPVGNPVRDLPKEPAAIAAWAGEASPALLVTTADHLAAVERETGSLGLRAIGEVPIIHINKSGRRMRILVLERSPIPPS
jgi:4-amino-4-deoxy-L-arabinose transferase-like glycosyltransferase